MSKEPHLALYRKYRPSTFGDVVGQEQLVNLLTNSIKQNKIAHAYLFCGGKGTGKTTVARIFARDIGCNPEDIIEIDAASNRGIDEIRELREAVRTAPFSSPYKVYIVDEAHMLTKEAANALLKTLEEPPSHVIFILATTDPEKLPATIVSRCQKIIFKQPDIKTLADRLIYVSKKEGKKLSEDTAELIARHGNGSYRDALGILEQVLMRDGEVVEHKVTVSLLGIPEEELLIKLLNAICTKDAKSVLEVISTLEREDASAIRAYDSFLELLRTALLARFDEKATENQLIKELVSKYPHVIGSKMVLELLEKRQLLEVSDNHSWTAFTAILLAILEL
ncbi:MAG: DNA polymerase III subunit gamma/tau [Candidatus Paceibacterota bacterium]|jgi:DNA polymerase-3 subunit gamma/tau